MKIEINKLENYNYAKYEIKAKEEIIDTKINNEDEIDFNSGINLMEEFMNIARENENIRESKVEQLKKLYLDGKYEISGKEVSEKILGGK